MALIPGSSCIAAENAPLPTVEYVELERYLGTWFEIPSYPAWLQKNWAASTADYGTILSGLPDTDHDPVKLIRIAQPAVDSSWPGRE